MKNSITILFSLIFFLAGAAKAEPLASCGPYTISSSNDGYAHINNVRPQSQKFNFLGKDGDYSNVKYQWILPDQSNGRWLGMDYVKRNGKAILNVEAIRMKMNEPRLFWSYDCLKTNKRNL
ncbi:hypothetical protein HPO94_03225 [Citrobacter portucalensis]|uniref:hypothetical protein n=1 Tax=Citrobacter portucalensis TaxID=1639133 RepID=UPI002FF30314